MINVIEFRITRFDYWIRYQSMRLRCSALEIHMDLPQILLNSSFGLQLCWFLVIIIKDYFPFPNTVDIWEYLP